MDEVMRRAAEQARRALDTTGEGMQKILEAAPAPTPMHDAVSIIVHSYATALTPVMHALGEAARDLGTSWREAATRAARERDHRG